MVLVWGHRLRVVTLTQAIDYLTLVIRRFALNYRERLRVAFAAFSFWLFRRATEFCSAGRWLPECVVSPPRHRPNRRSLPIFPAQDPYNAQRSAEFVPVLSQV